MRWNKTSNKIRKSWESIGNDFNYKNELEMIFIIKMHWK